MKFRVGILLIVLAIRIILGFFQTILFKQDKIIRVTGNVDNISQTTSICIVKISKFIFSTANICAIKAGDRISVIGTLDKRVIEVLNGKMWLRDAEIEDVKRTQETKNAGAQVVGIVENFRMFFVSRLKKFVPEPEAGLIAGILLGYKKDIGRDLYQQMIDSGTIHIAVASGYNILLVGGSVLTLSFYLLRRRAATLVAIFGMFFYAMLAGGEPPVMRALWMAGILYIGMALGRGATSWWALVITGWLMLLIDPTLIASISFQLSVAASVGLLVVEPWMSKSLANRMGRGFVEALSGSGLLTTLSTMLTTMPFLWWHFGRLSLIGIVSNTLILPFVPILMILGVGVLVLPHVFWVPAYVVGHWMVVVIGFFGS